jgi:hypothetical protein
MMRNIIGQTKSGFNLRDIMDNKKILLVNLSKGKTGELNSQLLGMIFVMKFQAAAMGRADVPEDQREDFALYVDEFQNFATDSFESILSEARKYRLNLILANQFMTQLTDKIREAIIGNVGTVISGRIGTTDAELMVKRFSPTFDAEDLTRLPNYETIASVMINNVPSSPFSMSLIPPLGTPNPQLSDALKRLSAAKFGRQRGEVEREIFARLRAGDEARDKRRSDLIGGTTQPSGAGAKPPGSGSSFLDEWLAKRQQLKAASKPAQNPIITPSPKPAAPAPAPVQPVQQEPESAQPKVVSDELRNTQMAQLQRKGLGSNVSFNVSGTKVDEPTDEDNHNVDRALKKIEHAELADEPLKKPVDATTLKVGKTEEEDSLDEIYIDVRGNIHRPGEEEEEAANQESAPAPQPQATQPPQVPQQPPQPPTSNTP